MMGDLYMGSVFVAVKCRVLMSCVDGVLFEKRWVMMVCFQQVQSTTSSRNHLNI